MRLNLTHPPGRNCLLLALCLSATPAAAELSERRVVGVRDLIDLSITDLMEVEIYSVSKKRQRLSETAAAISVVSGEELRRAGINTLGEAMRLVPGVSVNRGNSNGWAIGIRGLTIDDANKLLVLMDGRSLYSPVHSFVHWNSRDIPLENIERIEVIRGPGSAVWGANAVNGVVNIISKPAADTQGGLLSLGVGKEQIGSGLLRYGDRLGDNGHYRVYGRGFLRDGGQRDGVPSLDRADRAQAGFRADWQRGGHSLNLQGEAVEGSSFSGRVAATEFETAVRERYLQGSWNYAPRASTEYSLHWYYDSHQHTYQPGGDRDRYRLWDLEFQQRQALGLRQELSWGLGYRRIQDEATSNNAVMFGSPSQTYSLFSVFLQSEVFLDHAYQTRLSFGTKLEHHYNTGWEFQPSARLMWTPNPRHSVWGGVTRAVRVPSRMENDTDIQLEVAGAPYSAFLGDENLAAEKLTAYELGYRWQPRPNLSLELNAFANAYLDLIAVHRLPEAPSTRQYFNSGSPFRTWGAEAALKWQPTPRWQIHTAYSWLDGRLRLKNGEQLNWDPERLPITHQQWQLRSFFNLGRDWELDTGIYYTSAVAAMSIPANTRLDLRLGWQVSPQLELSLGVQNALDPAHPEANLSTSPNSLSEIEREFYARVNWRF